jgi:polyisoprenoid-binding protein YceI
LVLNKYFSILIFFGITLVPAMSQNSIYRTANGIINFKSDAPLEVITATSKKMEGAINADALTFAFSLPVRSFEGFNNGLQRQHFYENYLETDKYPTATFTGKIIEHVNLKIPGTYTVRAKGQLNIHGHTKERIIKIEIISTGTELKAKASFIVPLVDHQIEVPRIVNQKIAQEIAVHVQGIFLLEGKS